MSRLNAAMNRHGRLYTRPWEARTSPDIGRALLAELFEQAQKPIGRTAFLAVSIKPRPDADIR